MKLNAQNMNASSPSIKRSKVEKHCPGCGKPAFRLRSSGVCGGCEKGGLTPQQQEAVAKARPEKQPKLDIKKGSLYYKDGMLAFITDIDYSDDTPLVCYRAIPLGAELYKELSRFRDEFRIDVETAA